MVTAVSTLKPIPAGATGGPLIFVEIDHRLVGDW